MEQLQEIVQQSDEIAALLHAALGENCLKESLNVLADSEGYISLQSIQKFRENMEAFFHHGFEMDFTLWCEFFPDQRRVVSLEDVRLLYVLRMLGIEASEAHGFIRRSATQEQYTYKQIFEELSDSQGIIRQKIGISSTGEKFQEDRNCHYMQQLLMNEVGLEEEDAVTIANLSSGSGDLDFRLFNMLDGNQDGMVDERDYNFIQNSILPIAKMQAADQITAKLWYQMFPTGKNDEQNINLMTIRLTTLFNKVGLWESVDECAATVQSLYELFTLLKSHSKRKDQSGFSSFLLALFCGYFFNPQQAGQEFCFTGSEHMPDVKCLIDDLNTRSGGLLKN